MLTDRMRSLSSPAAAFSRQAQLELGVTVALEHAATRFLNQTLQLVTDTPRGRGLPLPGPIEVSSLWEAQLTEALATIGDGQARDYLRPALAADGFGEAVYEAVRDVILATALSPNPTDRVTLEATLREVLMLDSPAVELSPPALTASLDHSLDAHPAPLSPSHFPSHITASLWDQLAATGSTWLIRIQRTARTAATGLSGYLAMQAISASPRYSHKRWVARHDDLTRDTHRAVDGTTIPTDHYFQVGGQPLLYPGERGGSYEEIVNCRCVLVGVS